MTWNREAYNVVYKYEDEWMDEWRKDKDRNDNNLLVNEPLTIPVEDADEVESSENSNCLALVSGQ